MSEAEIDATAVLVDNSEGETNRPPTPWRSSRAKQRIIDELSEPSSDIFLLIGNYTFKDFGSVNFAKLREKYANNQYPASNFRETVKRLLRHLLNGTGDFEKKENGVEKWYTSPGNVSKAYSLLFLLHMDQSKSRVINAMTDEQLWESHDQFKLYDFAKFKEYNKRMKDLTSKKKERIRNEEAAFNRDMLKLPPKNTTARG